MQRLSGFLQMETTFKQDNFRLTDSPVFMIFEFSCFEVYGICQIRWIYLDFTDVYFVWLLVINLHLYFKNEPQVDISNVCGTGSEITLAITKSVYKWNFTCSFLLYYRCNKTTCEIFNLLPVLRINYVM